MSDHIHKRFDQDRLLRSVMKTRGYSTSRMIATIYAFSLHGTSQAVLKQNIKSRLLNNKSLLRVKITI